MSELGGDGALNMSYEGVPGGSFPLDIETAICGGVVVRAGKVEISQGREHPVLIFDFKLATGAPLAPITLILERAELKALPGLIRDAAEGALEATK